MPTDRLYEDLQFQDRDVYSNVNSLAGENQKSVVTDTIALQRKLRRWRIAATLFILVILLIIALGVAAYVSNYKKTKVGRAEMQQLKADVCIKGVSPCRYCAYEWLYLSGNCYFLSKDEKNWTESRKNCQLLNSTLAVIQNAEEEKFIAETAREIVWIGLSRDNNGAFVWEDRSPYREDNSFWQEDEPNDLSNRERCVELYPFTYGNGSGWNDNKCTHERQSVCERRATILTA